MPELDLSPRLTVLNILAVSYSGSTWANLMLGGHPDCFNVGEFDRVKKMGRAICTLHHDQCPLWTQFDYDSEENPFLQAARLTGKRVLIVNNVHRLREPLQHPRIDRRYLVLLRDGRDVVASDLRKHPEQGAIRCTREWVKNTRRRLRWARRDRQARSLIVPYERLRRHPEEVLKACCELLEISPQLAVGDPNQAHPHFIGGSTGPLSRLARHHGLTHLHVQRHDRQVHALDINQPQHTIYDQGERVTVDFSRYQPGAGPPAKLHLTPAQRRWFKLLGGPLNRRLGYT